MSNLNNTQKIKYCSFCGSEIRMDAQFCFACGHKFDMEPNNTPTPPVSSMVRRNEIALKIAEKKEQIAAKIVQRKKEHEAKKALRKEAWEKKRQEKKAKKKTKNAYRKGIFVGIFIACLVFAIGGFFIIGAMTYGTYEETYIYYYTSASPGSVEDCNIYVDTGSINIQYNATPVNYHVKVEANLRVTGLFVSGKTYQNFYNPINWENTSSASFSLTTNLWSWIDPTNWIKMQNTAITVTLRTDVVYNISASSTTGAVSLSVPENSTINDLFLTCVTGGVSLYSTETNFTGSITCGTTTGGILLNFTSCVFNGDIQGTAVTGGIELNSYNANYTQNINLNLGTTTGGVVMNIKQYDGMGANITGAVSTVTGGISITYIDSVPDIGAKFTATAVTGEVSLPSGSGFTLIDLQTSKTLNYDMASSIYTITSSTTTGSISITGTSI